MDNRVYRPEDPSYLEVHNYENTIRISTPHHDSNSDDWIQMFYTAMVGITFPPECILTAMKEFAEEQLESFKDDEGDPNN